MVFPLRLILRNFEEAVAGTLLVLMALATLLNVASRYILNSPIPWAEEFSRYAFIWLVFVGAVVCTKHAQHIRIDLLIASLPSRIQSYANLLADVATATLMLILIYYGSVLALGATQPTSTLGVPTYVIYLIVPLTATLILYYTVRNMLSIVRSGFGRGAEQ